MIIRYVYFICTDWFLCINLTQTRVIKKEGASVEERPPWDFNCKAFSQLVINGGGQQFPVGSTIHGMVSWVL